MHAAQEWLNSRPDWKPQISELRLDTICMKRLNSDHIYRSCHQCREERGCDTRTRHYLRRSLVQQRAQISTHPSCNTEIPEEGDEYGLPRADTTLWPSRATMLLRRWNYSIFPSSTSSGRDYRVTSIDLYSTLISLHSMRMWVMYRKKL